MINPEREDFGTVEMWLTRDSALSDWQLINARVRYSTHSTRVLFDEAMSIDDVFVPQIASVLQTHLMKVNETAVFSHSEFRAELPTLRLEGLRVLTHKGKEGAASANVRFVRGIGDLNAAFKPPYCGVQQPDPTLEDITVPVLQELLYPALEAFDHILENGLSEEHAKLLTARVKTMRTKRDELSDYIGLLTRYVETMSARKQQGSLPAHADAHKRALELSVQKQIPSQNITWSSQHGVRRGVDSNILHGHIGEVENDKPAARDRFAS